MKEFVQVQIRPNHTDKAWRYRQGKCRLSEIEMLELREDRSNRGCGEPSGWARLDPESFYCSMLMLDSWERERVKL